ncbi:MAG: 4Fe-4S dicluster domain-containing protein [Gammaproteobacteria bacterium]|nr:4Fe-4S dicluster domain-containing protein [Gammaproteobacteria bacterium]
MTNKNSKVEFLPRSHFQELIEHLQQAGYTCVGPQVHEHAIHYAELAHADFLPQGMSEEQSPGQYRLHEAGHDRYFAWANGPQALKPLLFTPREALWQSSNNCEDNASLCFKELIPEQRPLAVIGARACDLAALYIHDKHFLQHGYRDPYYLARRKNMLLIAVNCTHPADTCFCASTGDGPRATYGYDLLLNELDDGFIIESHSEKGVAIQTQLNLQAAEASQLEQANDAVEQAAARQTRGLPAQNLSQPLLDNLHHPHWEEVAQRCLSCGNCTAVCPTCFCHSELDEPVLDGSHSVHYRQWDSCFCQKHSYIHGMTIRDTAGLRYRQWMTHKLGSWHEQFGRSGCVGCGRCITWCPVGIDITEEAKVICSGDQHD